MENKKSQIWVETAIYTLIGLTIIAILLAIVNPQIDKMKEKSIIRQAMDTLDAIDGKLQDVSQSSGGVGIVTVKIGKGEIAINSTNDSIRYNLRDIRLEFSQVGEDVKSGNIIVRTEKHGSRFNVYLTRYYAGEDLSYNNQQAEKVLQAGAVPYKLRMENTGVKSPDDKIIIDFNIIG